MGGITGCAFLSSSCFSNSGCFGLTEGVDLSLSYIGFHGGGGGGLVGLGGLVRGAGIGLSSTGSNVECLVRD